MAAESENIMNFENSIVNKEACKAAAGVLPNLHSHGEDIGEDICVDIYVAENCFVCEYAYEIADRIRQDFPQVNPRIINITTTAEEIPDAVFATPTYLLNGRVWSLGNPSPQQVQEKLQSLLRETVR